MAWNWLDRTDGEVKEVMQPGMRNQLRIAVLIYSMTNAVIFGAGLITVLNVSALRDNAFIWIPIVVIASLWSWSNTACSARLGKPHPSGARCSKAEACKPRQETETSTKDHETKTFARAQRVRQPDRKGVSGVLRESACCLASTQSH